MFRGVHMGVGGNTPFAQPSNYQTSANHSFRDQTPYETRRQTKRKCTGCGSWAEKGTCCLLCATPIPADKKPVNRNTKSPVPSARSYNSNANEVIIKKVVRPITPVRSVTPTIMSGRNTSRSPSANYYNNNRAPSSSMRSGSAYSNSNNFDLKQQLPLANGKSPVASKRTALSAKSPNVVRVMPQQQQQQQQLKKQHDQDATTNSLQTYRAATALTRHQQQHQQAPQHHHQHMMMPQQQQPQPQYRSGSTMSSSSSSAMQTNNTFYELYKSMLTRSQSRSPSMGRAGSIATARGPSASSARADSVGSAHSNSSMVSVKCTFCGTLSYKGCICRVCHMKC